jgi:aldehyde dehydrogenase (NAD+)
MSKEYKIETRLFIDGKFTEGHNKKTFSLQNPATEEVVAEVYEADERDVDDAVAAAKKAQPSWEKSPPQFKSGLLRKLAELIRRDVDELGYLEAISMGRYL